MKPHGTESDVPAKLVGEEAESETRLQRTALGKERGATAAFCRREPWRLAVAMKGVRRTDCARSAAKSMERREVLSTHRNDVQRLPNRSLNLSPVSRRAHPNSVSQCKSTAYTFA